MAGIEAVVVLVYLSLQKNMTKTMKLITKHTQKHQECKVVVVVVVVEVACVVFSLVGGGSGGSSRIENRHYVTTSRRY